MRTWERYVKEQEALAMAEAEPNPAPKFMVIWDNGNDTGAFSERFETEQEAIDFAEDWRQTMVQADNDPDEAEEAYSYIVQEDQA
jgi:hypothetical protein